MIINSECSFHFGRVFFVLWFGIQFAQSFRLFFFFVFLLQKLERMYFLIKFSSSVYVCVGVCVSMSFFLSLSLSFSFVRHLTRHSIFNWFGLVAWFGLVGRWRLLLLLLNNVKRERERENNNFGLWVGGVIGKQNYYYHLVWFFGGLNSANRKKKIWFLILDIQV